MGSPVIGFFFAGCMAATIIIIIFTKSRTNYYRDVELRVLATKDPLLNLFFALILFSLVGFLLVDVFLVVGQAINGHGGKFDSMTLMGEGIDKSHAWFYIISELIPTMWLCWALNKEVQIYKKLRNARTLLLLGELPSAEESRIPTPPSAIESDKPATFAEVLQAMDSELKKALQDAETLKVELTATKLKVVNLEVEVQEKNSEISQIKDSKSHFNDIIEDSSGDDKSLSLTDSVMMGDSIMGGVKIDKQINNDPAAIARAVIDAYRMGKNDSD
ncbi:MAG: hypothetical protein P8Q55_05945 [Candidatus Poseidoniaceae archaeon]|nr:hypothetical protein [Candidatus Poseidoniaceae archaeon]